MPNTHRALLQSVRLGDAEILALRHQILVPQRQIKRAQFNLADRTIVAMLSTVFDRRQ